MPRTGEEETVFVVQRLNWTRSVFKGREVFLRLPGVTRLRSFASEKKAEALRQEMEEQARARVNPFRCGNVGLSDKTSLDSDRLHDWLLEAGDDYLKARMPVDCRTRQPAGVLHGGASVALAETLASWAARYCVDPAKHHCVGLEINANHVRPVAEGYVYGTARPLHLGRTTQLWDVRITTEDGD